MITAALQFGYKVKLVTQMRKSHFIS